jgi:hypothetical protein
LRQSAPGRRSSGLTRAALERAPWRVVTTDGRPAGDIRVERSWRGDVCRSRIVNGGSRPVRLRDFWTGDERGRHPGGRLSVNLPARTAQLLVCTPS